MNHTLPDIVTLILALSTASERLVTLIKGSSRWLNTPNKDADKERWRQWVLRLIAIGSGLITAFLSSEFILQQGYSWLGIVGLGLMAAGGSDLWNSSLGYLNSLKDQKKGAGEKAKVGLGTA